MNDMEMNDRVRDIRASGNDMMMMMTMMNSLRVYNLFNQ